MPMLLALLYNVTGATSRLAGTGMFFEFFMAQRGSLGQFVFTVAAAGADAIEDAIEDLSQLLINRYSVAGSSRDGL